MKTRMLSFFADIENALMADDPAPSDGGSWETSRIVNYQLGLARLTLAVRIPAGGLESRGSITLQSYALADGTSCLRAVASWTGSDNSRSFAIYSKPGSDWKREARKIGAEWMAGPPPSFELTAYPVQRSTAEAVAVAG